jgi:hypothetical protein
MRNISIVALLASTGLGGCIGTLPMPPATSASPPSVQTIGASGGYQVRNVAIALPELSCGGTAYPETRDAYVGGFKRAYIESWNAALDARRLGVAVPKTAAQKKQRDYLFSHAIKATKEEQEAMHEYETKPTRVTMARSPQAGSPAEREEYRRAACIRDAYNRGSTEGGRQGDEEVRSILKRAPPDD